MMLTMSNRPRNRTIKKQKRCLSTAEAAAAGSSCAPPYDRWGSRGGKAESSQARLRSCHRRRRRSSCRRSLQSNYEEKCRCPSPLSKAHPRCIPHTLVSAAKHQSSHTLPYCYTYWRKPRQRVRRRSSRSIRITCGNKVEDEEEG